MASGRRNFLKSASAGSLGALLTACGGESAKNKPNPVVINPTESSTNYGNNSDSELLNPLSIGINLGWFARGGPLDFQPYINRAKAAWPWIVRGDEPVKFDQNGYCETFSEKTVVASKILNCSSELSSNSYFSGRFRLYGDGDGEIRVDPFSTWAHTNQLPKEIIFDKNFWYFDFDYTPDNSTVQLELRSINHNNYIRDIALINMTHHNDFKNGKIFSPELISDLSQMNPISTRYLNQTLANKVNSKLNANGTVQKRFLSRANYTYNTSASSGSIIQENFFYGAIPFEDIIELSNIMGSDPWINIPPEISDEEVKNIVEISNANLSSDLSIYWEYGNEFWNSAHGFDCFNFAINQSNEMGYNSLQPLEKVAHWVSLRSNELFSLISRESNSACNFVLPGAAWSAPHKLDGTINQSSYSRLILNSSSFEGTDRYTHYAIGFYYGGGFSKDGIDEPLLLSIAAASTSAREAAELLSSYIEWGWNERATFEISDNYLKSPIDISDISAPYIGVFGLIQSDISAGLDPVTELDQVLRVNSGYLQYRAVDSSTWSSVAKLHPSIDSIQSLLAQVRICGWGYFQDGMIYSGPKSGLCNLRMTRLQGHSKFARTELDLPLIAYEGGPHFENAREGFEDIFSEISNSDLIVGSLDKLVSLLEEYGVELYMHYKSHNWYANGRDNWGVKSFIGQANTAKMDALLNR